LRVGTLTARGRLAAGHPSQRVLLYGNLLFCRFARPCQWGGTGIFRSVGGPTANACGQNQPCRTSRLFYLPVLDDYNLASSTPLANTQPA